MLTTLCYIEKDNQYLMLHRIKKEKDINRDKWIGVGGKFKPGESPEECLLRECREETGLELKRYALRGIVTFVAYSANTATKNGGTVNEGNMPAAGAVTEYMFLYTASAYEGNLKECDEGKLEWVSKDKIPFLNLWEGDLIFFKLLEENAPFFSLKLVYAGDVLTQAFLNGVKMP